MSTGQIISLTLQGAVFLVWAGLLVSVFFTLRDRAQARTGETSGGPGAFFTELKVWLRDPDDKSMRSTVFFITFCLALMVGQTAIMG